MSSSSTDSSNQGAGKGERIKGKRGMYLRYVLSVVFVFLMMLVAELTGEREVIFPETAAILVGFWVVPQAAWYMSRVRLVGLLTAAALLGYLLVVALEAPLYVKYLIGFAFCGVMLNATRCNIWPMFSAVILPLLIHADSIVYPISVFVILTCVALGEVVLERLRLCSSKELKLAPKPDVRSWKAWLGRFVLFALLAAPAMFTGQYFLVVPPVIVAYAGFTTRDNPLHEHWVKTVAVFAVVSSCGALIRGFLDLGLGLNTTLCASLAVSLAYVFFELFDVRLPPIAASALLPWVIDTSKLVLYPIELTCGAFAFIGLAHLMFYYLPRRREA
jgi:hypothetical protein